MIALAAIGITIAALAIGAVGLSLIYGAGMVLYRLQDRRRPVVPGLPDDGDGLDDSEWDRLGEIQARYHQPAPNHYQIPGWPP